MSWFGSTNQTNQTRPSAAYYNTGEAKASLSALLRRVRRGEVIVIAHAGHPVAKLVPFKQDIAVHPGVVRLSVYVDEGGESATPTQSSPEASTSHRELLD
ncbi:MAG: type II toxin-antitoxin system Phd/YefM family antitoxin [Gaiellaceae bacterium]